MTTNKKPNDTNPNCHATANTIYGLGLVGALIYYLQQSSTIVEGLIGILKSIVWPAILIYRVFSNLQL
jgi:hypothetical protein